MFLFRIYRLIQKKYIPGFKKAQITHTTLFETDLTSKQKKAHSYHPISNTHIINFKKAQRTSTTLFKADQYKHMGKAADALQANYAALSYIHTLHL